MYSILYGTNPFEEGFIGDSFRRDSIYEKKEFSWYLPLINRLLCIDPDDRLSLIDAVQILQHSFESRFSLRYYRKYKKTFDLLPYSIHEINNEDFKKWKELADQGDINSQYKLALSLPNQTDRNKYLQLLVDQNHPIAQCIKGKYCFNGVNGYKEDKNEALNLFLLSANQNFAIGQNNAGFCYLHGISKENPADFEKAMDFFKKALIHGHFGAQKFYAISSKQFENPDLKESLRLLILSANQSVVSSTILLSNVYKSGIGVIKNTKKTFQLLKIASKIDFTAMPQLAYCYHEGIGTEVNTKKAVKLLKIAAENKDVFGSFYLGCCYYDGIIIEKDLHEAYRLIKMAADNNYNEAQFSLVRNFYFNTDVDDDCKLTEEEAYTYLRYAAKNGLGEAQYVLAAEYEKIALQSSDDERKAKFSKKSLKYLMLASENGIDSATCDLGLKYLVGKGCEENIPKGFKLVEKATHNGDPYSLFKLAICYFEGIGVNQNEEKCIELVKLSSDSGCDEASLFLSQYYYSNKEYKKSFDLCKKVADLGNAEAQYELAVCYRDGIGVEKNPEEELRLYLLSSKQGFPKAIFNLGCCLLGGTNGLDVNDEEAFNLFLKVSDVLPNAAYNVAHCYANGLGVEQNYNEAVKYYQLASAGGVPEAHYNLALCYRDGFGVKKDLNEYYRYLKLSTSSDTKIPAAEEELLKFTRYKENQVSVVKMLTWSFIIWGSVCLFWSFLPKNKFWRY